MRLMLVISSLETGGAERVMTVLAGAWVRRGWHVDLVTTHDAGKAPFYPVDGRVNLLSADAPGRSAGAAGTVARIRDLRRLVVERTPDVVLSFLNYTNVVTLLATTGMEVPVVVSERLDPRVQPIGPVWGTLRRLLYRRVAALVVQTEASAEWFRTWLGDRTAVIPNPVLEPRFSGAPEVDVHRPSVAAMGRLHPQKGFDTLLGAMAKVVRHHPDWHLVVLGEGPLRGELEARRDALGLAGNVRFVGRMRRPPDVLHEAEIFVLSSVTEGFPNVLCEAMAVGLPVVATNCPAGPEDIVRQEVDGLLVPVGDEDAMAAALLRLIEDEQFRQSCRDRAGEIVERFSLANVLEAWDRILTVRRRSGSRVALT